MRRGRLSSSAFRARGSRLTRFWSPTPVRAKSGSSTLLGDTSEALVVWEGGPENSVRWEARGLASTK